MSSAGAVPNHVNDNITTIAELHVARQRRVGRHQRAIERSTRALGHPATLYAIGFVVLVWTGYNTLAPRFGWAQLDPAPFFWLQGALTLYAASIATMVLTAQNRQTRENEHHAHLQLQVNLLSEQKAAKIISLLEELRRDLPNVMNRRDTVAEAMQTSVDPKAVLSMLETTIEDGGAIDDDAERD